MEINLWIFLLFIVTPFNVLAYKFFFENARDKMLKEQRECESIPFSFFSFFFFQYWKEITKVYWKIEKNFVAIISVLGIYER